MSDHGVVHLVYNALWDHPVMYSKCSQSLSELFRSEFGDLYRYVQKVYEKIVSCGLLYVVQCNTVCDLEVVHLVYNALRNHPGRYS